MARRLWGYEGPMLISVLSDNFYLLEFQSIELCDSVLERSWHIHNSGLVLRRWYNGIKPLCFSPAATPEWILLKNVLPVLIIVDGISWVSSKIGKPLNMFVRDGLNVKVCVLRNKAIPCPEIIKVEVEDDIVEDIEILSFQAREYKKEVIGKVASNGTKAWVAKDKIVSNEKNDCEASASGVIPEAAKQVCETPSDVEVVTGSNANGAGTGTSKMKKRRKNRKKNLDKALQSVSAAQPAVLPVSNAGAGNASASPFGGMEAPGSSIAVQGVGGRPCSGSEASLQVEKSYGPVTEKMPEDEGAVYNCSEDEQDQSSNDEMQDENLASKKVVWAQQKVISGVKTRKNRRR
ncbi:hypothetical protein LINPERPRIM_LOCUS14453 [Linum perenne]